MQFAELCKYKQFLTCGCFNNCNIWDRVVKIDFYISLVGYNFTLNF